MSNAPGFIAAPEFSWNPVTRTLTIRSDVVIDMIDINATNIKHLTIVNCLIDALFINNVTTNRSSISNTDSKHVHFNSNNANIDFCSSNKLDEIATEPKAAPTLPDPPEDPDLFKFDRKSTWVL